MKMLKKISKLILLLPLVIQNIYGKTSEEYLSEAKSFTIQGKYHDALDAYGKAIVEEPENYLIYIKRAFALLNLNRNEAAIEDFSKVIKIKPDFNQAYIHRAKAYLKECNLNEAENDLNVAFSKNPSNDTKNILENVSKAKESLQLYKVFGKSGNYQEAIEQLNIILGICPQTLNLRLERADYYMKIGQTEQAMGDLLRATKLQPDNTNVLLQLSKLHMNMGEINEALSDVKECLHRDPENKPCKSIFKELKRLGRLQKSISNDVQEEHWASIIEKVDGENGFYSEAEKLGALNLRQYTRNILCKAYVKEKNAENSKKWCDMAVELDSQNIDNYVYRGDAYMLSDEYEIAIQNYNKAREFNPQNPQIMEKLQRAQKLMKLAKQKNYYKILDVPKTATKKEIKKAYRKLAQQFHPDKYEGDMTKEQVQNKMSEINEAYEILSNDELRERYDNGEDPNDPNGGQENPFAGFQFQNGGFPFGNGNFQFHFKF